MSPQNLVKTGFIAGFGLQVNKKITVAGKKIWPNNSRILLFLASFPVFTRFRKLRLWGAKPPALGH
jgi:hypothetical protein